MPLIFTYELPNSNESRLKFVAVTVPIFELNLSIRFVRIRIRIRIVRKFGNSFGAL